MEQATLQTDIRSQLEKIVEEVSTGFESADKARDLALSLQRKIIKHCSLSIRALHRREEESAEKLMATARELLSQAEGALRGHPDIYYAGFLQDAQKEYAEARLTQCLIAGTQLPGPADVGVGFAPYMNGLGEAVGEMRRYTLDRIRAGDLEESERILEVMDEIYCALIEVDFPDAITRGLRRSTDLARACLERTRGDLTNHFDRRRVERALEWIEKREL